MQKVTVTLTTAEKSLLLRITEQAAQLGKLGMGVCRYDSEYAGDSHFRMAKRLVKKLLE